MPARSFGALILLTAAAFSPVAPLPGRAGAHTLTEAAALEDGEISEEEQREARELAVRLVKRLREADDFAPVVSEFFPTDFAERVRQFVLSQPPDHEALLFCEHEVVRSASADDLRRTYVALMNFWRQQDILGAAAWDYVKIEVAARGDSVQNDQGAWARHYRVQKEAVSDEAYRLASGDPLLETLFADFVRHGINDQEVTAVDAEEQEEEVDEATRFRTKVAIRDVARLRVFTEKLERCIPLLRKASEKLLAERKALASAHMISDDPDAYEPVRADPLSVYHLERETLKAEAFGLAAGAPLIKARIRPYEMALARLDGRRLAVLAVYPDFDGD